MRAPSCCVSRNAFLVVASLECAGHPPLLGPQRLTRRLRACTRAHAGKQLQKANPKNKPEDAPLRGDTAVVLGTGGAARALAFGAAERGALVVVIGRSFSKAAPIAAALKKSEGVASVAASYAKLEDGVTVPEIDVIINTTPLGMVGENEDKMAVSRELLEMVRFAQLGCTLVCLH